MFGGMTNLKQRRRKWKTTRKRRARQRSIAAESPRAATAPAHECPADAMAECSAGEKVVTRWAPVTSVNILSNLLLAVSSLCWGWRSRLIKVCSRLWGALFPSRVCLQEMNVLQQRVDELQVEMARLRSALQSFAVKQVGPAAVTLRDLLNVKLRKANAPLHKPQEEEDCPGSDTGAATSRQKPFCHSKEKDLSRQAISPEKKRAPLITMSDLRRVSLRSSHSDLPLKIGLHRTPSKSPLNLRKHLKKVNIDRSPGGPAVREGEQGDWHRLTPIMTQALRRKFQMAHPKSPSPSNRPVNRSFDDTNH
ncbi:hypothetical protein AOXY_G23256 [Acipenser oxyrinchus oxyrinchus]|uniref:Proline rich 11 n=1 Tax=Acipenser oxyrinchus oxyrinchus TaxID=40147 RepID=A0AAD8CUX0_ACIOX|nr:hypothetical protein AOXY_G23256 [Acipenser oxyrinchus oxyrinchus]